jgi:hypothetical protein
MIRVFIFTPFIVAAISPETGQDAQGQQYWTQYGFPLIKYAGAYLLGLFTFYLTVWRERSNRIQAGRDKFHEITADMRAKRDEWKDKPEIFIEQSVPVLRQAVYRVERFAKDWPGLHRVWLEYEAKDYKTTELTAFSCLVDDVQSKHHGTKTALDMLSDYLNKFDAYVA